ncbi:LysR family transcriptional regulator [Archangium violaceum]|uniref:LysR family transcriptional regulator n=1 Tax=Archangium violaceum TaxID=83451 RepID=UPI00193C3265|nr:LysR family transcriptional regulator [Archangium violaceum]QRK06614.1 LysR family transcriptional regulator [Archangium violaceum]
MDIPWEDVRLFLAVAETGSLSGAARKLRIGQPTVSRRLAALEYSLGAALFRRSVDGASLTSAGERLLVPAKKMAEWAGEVGRAVDSSDRSPRGLVRITASPYLSFDFLAPFAAWLAGKHPGLRLEVLSSVQYLDLNRGEADLALRGKAPSQEGLKQVLALEFENAVCVSKSLAAKLPRKPSLSDLPWIAWSPPFDLLPPNPQLEELIPGFTPAFTSDNYLVQLAAAEAGIGAMVMARFRHRFSRPTSLVPLSIDLGPFQRSTLHLVCAKSALDIPRVRRVSELLVSELEKTGVSKAS